MINNNKTITISAELQKDKIYESWRYQDLVCTTRESHGAPGLCLKRFCTGLHKIMKLYLIIISYFYFSIFNW